MDLRSAEGVSIVTHPLRRAALRTMAASTAAVALLWLVFIQTLWGRRFGDRAWSGRSALSQAARELNDTSLRSVTVTTLVAGCLALVFVGLLRRRVLVGLAGASCVAATTLTAEFLKRVVIDRPATPGELQELANNSFPSGHVSISTSLALAAIVVTPQRWRKPVGAVAALWVTFQAAGVLAAGWHRPSDAVAGYGVALFWAAFAVWVLARIGQAAPETTEVDSTGAMTVVMLGVLVLVLSGLAVAAFGDGSAATADRLPLVAANAVIDVVGVAVVWWFWKLLHGWSLGAAADGPEH